MNKEKKMVCGWIVSPVLAVFIVLVLLGGQPWLAIAPGLLMLVLFPPVRMLAMRITGFESSAWIRIILVSLLVVGYFASYFAGMARQETIYLSNRSEERLMDLYDEGMDRWTVPWEEQWVYTSFGDVHVVSAGDPNKPPALLLHASAMGAWSWGPNIETLTRTHRIHAIDIIGEAGKSRLTSLDRFVFSDEDIEKVNSEILDELGLDKVLLVGGSAGGHQSMRFASMAPERITGLILSGPMGLHAGIKSLAIMTVSMVFPIPPVQRATGTWALGRSQVIRNQASDWFYAVTRGVIGRPTAPRQLSAEQLSAIKVPVLLILGTDDNLVGDPEKAAEHARNMTNIRIDILESGHLISMERSEEVNRLISEFLHDHQNL
jgi:pimeloyl-ACP methyl ester carboxylesterase